MSKGMFPQPGIVTSYDETNGLAKVFLPLYKLETDWIPIAKHLIDISFTTGVEVVVVFLNGNADDGVIVARL